MQKNPQASFSVYEMDTPPTKKETSEAELHLKELLKKQLDTETSLQKELTKKKKEFSVSSLLVDDQASRTGVKTLREFKAATQEENELLKLRDYGLTDEEILLKLKTEGGQIPKLPKRPRYGESTDSEQKKLDAIQSKIETHEKTLHEKETYSNTKEMSRLHMEIESSLHKGTEKAQKLQHLVSLMEKKFAENDPVLMTLKEYEAKTRSKKDDPNIYDGEESEDSEDDNAFIGPILAPLHVRIKPIDERIVQARRLEQGQLTAIPRFKNYEAGTPSKVLYIKNLAKKTTVEDLAAIFGRYNSSQDPTIEYQLMKGRMRGQAFVSFQDIETTTQALSFANGYVLHGKPMVVSFGLGKAHAKAKETV